VVTVEIAFCIFLGLKLTLFEDVPFFIFPLKLWNHMEACCKDTLEEGIY
jgi:hypothetical protein